MSVYCPGGAGWLDGKHFVGRVGESVMSGSWLFDLSDLFDSFGLFWRFTSDGLRRPVMDVCCCPHREGCVVRRQQQ